ncbi:MAG: isochorismate synthase [Micrococcales bacterium 73-15]|uniref:isochorismate synthase n=1 Tax=Salana multivorans TaxID=120377 RepID=UPI000960C140|nr:isochorismate synthase [Salana multivorans]OJX93858.1 MAG: isochorismate synthase [Micrococcales bacterium 73-15]
MSEAATSESPSRALAPARVSVRTLEIDDPGDLLALLPDGGPDTLVWLRRDEGMVAWGEAARIDTRGEGRMLTADARLRELAAASTVVDEVNLPGTGLVAFGSFAFDDEDPSGGTLVVPRVLVGRRQTPGGVRAWVTLVDAAEGTDAGVGDDPGVTGALAGPRSPVREPRDVTWEPGAHSGEDWMARVADAVARIRRGDAAKIVLARDAVAVTSEPLDLRALTTRFARAYPTTWTFAVDSLVGATPELLVRRERGLVASRVLAGTIRRTGNDEADLAHAAALARSSKDLEEHELAVASLAEALEPFVASANVPEVPSVLHLPNVMHLATDVTAVLAPGDASDAPDRAGALPSVLRLAAALHPTAAVGGTPTRVAVSLVREIEGMPRGRYAGPVGWLGADGDGEFCIALRCGRIESDDPRRIRVFAGCGIVAASDPQSELDETEAKFEPVRQALR